MLLTSAATALAVSTALVTLGAVATAAQQVSDRFDAFQATLVTVEDLQPEAGPVLDADAIGRLRDLDGLVQAGETAELDQNAEVAFFRGGGPEQGALAPLYATGGEALPVLGADLLVGRYFDEGNASHADAVVLIGSSLASSRPEHDLVSSTVFVGGRPYVIQGVFEAPPGRPELARAVVITTARAEAERRVPAARAVVVRTRSGAAEVVGEQLALFLDPADPERYQPKIPPDPRSLRQGVEDDVRTLGLIAAAVGLVLGGVSVANETLISVIERKGEIGLRRALGASSRDIRYQTLTESSLTALLGGVLGTVIGVLGLIVLSVLNRWEPVFDVRLCLVMPVVAAAVGFVAGLAPATRAARIQPAEALRTGT